MAGNSVERIGCGRGSRANVGSAGKLGKGKVYGGTLKSQIWVFSRRGLALGHTHIGPFIRWGHTYSVGTHQQRRYRLAAYREGTHQLWRIAWTRWGRGHMDTLGKGTQALGKGTQVFAGCRDAVCAGDTRLPDAGGAQILRVRKEVKHFGMVLRTRHT